MRPTQQVKVTPNTNAPGNVSKNNNNNNNNSNTFGLVTGSKSNNLSQTLSQAEQEELLAKERDLKFKIWLQNKSIKEKGFEVRSIANKSKHLSN
jgi:hypothetical protein